MAALSYVRTYTLIEHCSPFYRNSVVVYQKSLAKSEVQIKASGNRKVVDDWQKSFPETVLLEPANRVYGTMGKCTVSSQVTWNGKVGKCDLWTAHHTGDSERIW